MREFAAWLAATPPSLFIQEHNAWAIPTIQTVHIVGIGLVMGSVLMINLRILGLSGADQTLLQTERRFGPWMTAALWLLLATGLLLVVGEPARQLLSFSFWAKMSLVVVGTAIALAFRRSLRRHDQRWEQELSYRPSVRTLALVTLVLWAAVIVLGRLIGYDHLWGDWAPGQQV